VRYQDGLILINSSSSLSGRFSEDWFG